MSKDADAQDLYSEIHTVDAYFEPAPQYGHFISLDNSVFTQNELPPVAAMISHKFRASNNSVHPHAMGLRVPRSSSVVIVWRTSLLWMCQFIFTDKTWKYSTLPTRICAKIVICNCADYLKPMNQEKSFDLSTKFPLIE